MVSPGGRYTSRGRCHGVPQKEGCVSRGRHHGVLPEGGTQVVVRTRDAVLGGRHSTQVGSRDAVPCIGTMAHPRHSACMYCPCSLRRHESLIHETDAAIVQSSPDIQHIPNLLLILSSDISLALVQVEHSRTANSWLNRLCLAVELILHCSGFLLDSSVHCYS